jgi:chromosome segregation ATPase
LSLWQELEGLQKKKAELDGVFHSFAEQVKTVEERMKAIDGGLGIQEERMRKLEVQLKDKHEALSKLESKVEELEKILKRSLGEPVTEEEQPIGMTLQAATNGSQQQTEEPEEQPIGMTLQAATNGSQQQTEEPEEKTKKIAEIRELLEKQNKEKKRKHWL